MSPYSWSYARPSFFPLMILMVLWTLFWKAMALWKSSRGGEKIWFVALLLINTAGILEILYLFVFSKPSGLPKDLLPKDLGKPAAPKPPESPKPQA